MRIDWALLAKAAYATAGGAPSILAAGMTAIAVPSRDSFPPNVRLPDDAACGPVTLAIVMGLLASRAETGRASTIEVTVTDPDGNERFKMGAQIGIPVAPPGLPPGMDIAMHAILELVFVPARIEPHTVNVFLDGSIQKQIPLMIRVAPAAHLQLPPT